MKYFNVIDNGDAAVIYMYGDIGRFDGGVNATSIARELDECAENHAKIQVRINSLGGEVFEGIAICNALKACKANVEMYIDGVAASMAGVIAMCGLPVHMSQYARLMLHNVSGGCCGGKEDMKRCAEMIDGLEDTLCAILAAKAKTSKDEIKAAYMDGTDHWLTASEALSLGFVDSLYDAEEPDSDLYNFVNKKIKMKYEDLKKRARFAACASDEAVEREISNMEIDLDTAKAENAELKAKVAKFEADAAAARSAVIAELLDAAEADHRITATIRPSYKEMLELNFETGKKVLDALEPKKKVTHAGGDAPSAWNDRMKEIRKNRQ